MMIRFAVASALASAVLFAAPVKAATSQEKLETCKFGADEKKLTGAARKSYMARCTADRDSPRGKPVGGAASKAQ